MLVAWFSKEHVPTSWLKSSAAPGVHGSCQAVLDSVYKVNVVFCAPATVSVGKLTRSITQPCSSATMGLMVTALGGNAMRGAPLTKRWGGVRRCTKSHSRCATNGCVRYLQNARDNRADTYES